MGANAQTSVPTFTAGQVLTAAQVNQINTGIPVFADASARDAAFGGTGEKTLAEGQFAFLEDSNEVQFYDGSSWTKLGGSMTKVAAFTASGTWTVPAGVTYAIAHIRGGGGGIGSASSGTGGTSSVAFSGGTISAAGGPGLNQTSIIGTQGSSAAANSGQGAVRGGADQNNATFGYGNSARDGAYIVAADTVTPAASITVTVGAGGTAGTNGFAGGSGYVWITYQE